MSVTYLFYDIETTGLNKCFDQILQFAAIRTDQAFNELEHYDIRIKLRSDIIPSPRAVITHNIPIENMQNGECEYEAVQKIHKLLNYPGTISLGYNTLNFDDEFLRFAFYRNLLSPYTHQYANGCGRMDLFPMATMFFLYKNEALKWPVIDAKTSLKLEYLNEVNQLTAGDAHDAMVDAEITLALAKRFAEYSEMWNYLCTYFIKKNDLARIDKLTEAIIVDSVFGVANNYQLPVQFLGLHNHYKNQSLWLRLDTVELTKTTIDSIPETTYVVHKKPGETGLLLPFIDRFKQYFNKERLELVATNRQWLQSNPHLLEEIAYYYQEYKYPVIPEADIDTTLYYDGFWNDYEVALCNKFQQAPLSEKAPLVEQFPDSKLRSLAIRILARNYPDYLPECYSAEHNTNIDYQGHKRLTPDVALREIIELQKSGKLTAKQTSLLVNLKEYIKHHANQS